MSEDYYRLRSPQIAEAIANDWPIMICLGATEQHGRHLPIGTDTFQVEGLAREAIAGLSRRGVNLLLGPTIPFGPPQFQSEAPVDFAGTISISSDLTCRLIKQFCKELIRHGFRRIYVLIGNAESDAPAQIAAKEISEETDAVVTTVNWMVVISELYRGKIAFASPQGHGGAGETARIMAMMPELVDMASARSFHPMVRKSGVSGDDMPFLGGGVGRFKIPAKGFEPDFEGIVGAPSEATPEIGRQLIDIIGNWIADIVAHEESAWTSDGT